MNVIRSRCGLPFGFSLGLNIVTFIVALFITFFSAFSATTVLADATLTGSGHVDSYTFDSNKSRTYKVYVPEAYDGSFPVPMIMALHGCDMNNTDALNAWNLDIIADQNNVILVFPYVGSFSEMRGSDCWGYWFDHHVQEGGGGNSEVDYLYELAVEVESHYLIDPEYRFLTGFASGAAMAVAEAVAYNDYWTAAAPVAGLAYGDGSDSVLNEIFKSVGFHAAAINAELDYDRAVPMLVVQSSNDTVTLPRAMELIRDSQLSVWGGDVNVDETRSCAKGGVDCTLNSYHGVGGLLVRTMVYDGGAGRTENLGQGHYWTGGDDDLAVWSDDVNGPNASQIMWEFFEEITGVIVETRCFSDFTAPAPPTGLAVGSPSFTEVSVILNANSEDDLAGYNIYWDDGDVRRISFFDSTAIVLTELTGGTPYSIYATAQDVCGNQSDPSSSVTFDTPISSCLAVEVNALASQHFDEGRLDVAGLIEMGVRYGYTTPFSLWPTEDGGWDDVNNCDGPVSGCEEVSDKNYYHKTAGRATSSGNYWTPDYVANGSGDAMPGSTWGNTTLHSSNGSDWEMGSCP